MQKSLTKLIDEFIKDKSLDAWEHTDGTVLKINRAEREIGISLLTVACMKFDDPRTWPISADANTGELHMTIEDPIIWATSQYRDFLKKDYGLERDQVIKLSDGSTVKILHIAKAASLFGITRLQWYSEQIDLFDFFENMKSRSSASKAFFTSN